MLLKTEQIRVKYLGLMIVLSLYSHGSSAEAIQCTPAQNKTEKKLCTPQFQASVEQLNNLSLTTLLITDAPLRLIKDSQQLWSKRIAECKSTRCYEQQLEQRIDQLNFYTSINQTLTQHYLKFENGKMADQAVHLQIHQLSKDNIKIEGLAYRNPNNALDKQNIPFLAYSTVSEKNTITDNENDCKYQFHYQKAILKVTTEQKGCERFSGIYRLYD